MSEYNKDTSNHQGARYNFTALELIIVGVGITILGAIGIFFII